MLVLVVNPEVTVAPRVEVAASVASNNQGGVSGSSPFNFMKTKITKNKYPLVKVVWRDSNIYRLQDSVEYALDNYAIEIITTVGFLIGYQDKNPILVWDLLNKNIDQRCSVVIPVENIVNLVKVKMAGGGDAYNDDGLAWLPKTEAKISPKQKSQS